MPQVVIDVADEKEADAIKAGMEDVAVRAFVVVVGALSKLETQEQKQRALSAARILLGDLQYTR